MLSRASTIWLTALAAIFAAAFVALPISVSDPTVMLVVVFLASLATPRRFIWVTLAFWACFWIGWASYELVIWIIGKGKFGPMSWSYCLGGLVLLAAANLAYKRIQAKAKS